MQTSSFSLHVRFELRILSHTQKMKSVIIIIYQYEIHVYICLQVQSMHSLRLIAFICKFACTKNVCKQNLPRTVRSFTNFHIRNSSFLHISYFMCIEMDSNVGRFYFRKLKSSKLQNK